MAAKKASSEKQKVDPFKTRKSKVVESKVSDTITAPAKIAEAIDNFRECQEQAKHFEGEATIYKDAILKFAQKEYVSRVLAGMANSFKILGHDTMVTFIATDASAGITEEEISDFAKQWGQEAAEQLVVRDFGSIRFDPEVLQANYHEVVAALQVLPEKVLENLFKPMLMKAKSGATEEAKRYAKTPEDLQEILQALKIKNYIK